MLSYGPKNQQINYYFKGLQPIFFVILSFHFKQKLLSISRIWTKIFCNFFVQYIVLSICNAFSTKFKDFRIVFFQNSNHPSVQWKCFCFIKGKQQYTICNFVTYSGTFGNNFFGFKLFTFF